MNFRNSAICVIAVVAFSFSASTANAAPVPLPPGLTDYSGKSAQAPGKVISGTYIAAKMSGRFLRDENDRKLESAERDCTKAGRQFQLIGDRSTIGQEHIWVYFTETHSAQFSESLVVHTDSEKCTAVIESFRSVSRHLFANNILYSVDPPTPDASPSERTLVQFYQSETVPKRFLEYPFRRYDDALPRCGREERCERKRIAGVNAMCLTHSLGLGGDNICVAISPAAVRGYILSKVEYDDTPPELSSFEVTAIDGNAAINDAVFDWTMRWGGK